MAEIHFHPHFDTFLDSLAIRYLLLLFEFAFESSICDVSKFLDISTPRARSFEGYIVVSVWIIAPSFTRPPCFWMESGCRGQVHGCHMSQLSLETGL